jgi:hypothetical protein
MCRYCGYEGCPTTQKCSCGWDSSICTEDPYCGINFCPKCDKQEYKEENSLTDTSYVDW